MIDMNSVNVQDEVSNSINIQHSFANIDCLNEVSHALNIE